MISLSPGEEVSTSGEANYYGTKGTLYLTNKRLTFVYEKRGIIFKGKYTPINLPIEIISEVAIVGAGPFKKISINIVRDERSFGIPRYEFKVRDPEAWKTKIEWSCADAISRRTPTMPQIVPAKKCVSCGTLVEPHLVQCPVCGAQLT